MKDPLNKLFRENCGKGQSVRFSKADKPECGKIKNSIPKQVRTLPKRITFRYA